MKYSLDILPAPFCLTHRAVDRLYTFVTQLSNNLQFFSLSIEKALQESKVSHKWKHASISTFEYCSEGSPSHVFWLTFSLKYDFFSKVTTSGYRLKIADVKVAIMVRFVSSAALRHFSSISSYSIGEMKLILTFTTSIPSDRYVVVESLVNARPISDNVITSASCMMFRQLQALMISRNRIFIFEKSNWRTEFILKNQTWILLRLQQLLENVSISCKISSSLSDRNVSYPFSRSSFLLYWHFQTRTLSDRNVSHPFSRSSFLLFWNFQTKKTVW